MNPKANNIKNRLSLRLPQEQSLNILADLADRLTLQKNPDLASELAKVNTLYPTCIDFERSFPSMCFALATGVGKTRLMGAFISYLYTAKNIKNFFVLAPNLTIYEKLIGEFSDSSHPKYVFKGIAEFVANQPRVITGDNYEAASQMSMFTSEVHINVFNISKLNAETRGGKEPRIKRLAECLGESYFSYLAGLPDLVLLMDESHHYRADRGMEVINELNPILGLELTATPQVEKGTKPVKFRNVVYEYSLAKAIRDGFVKEPAVATRKDFDPTQYTAEELDRIKLEDGVRLHEDTKVALDVYARDYKVKQVKPFVLVVAKDTTHAGKLKKMIMSETFFNGYYSDKVMEIHSNQSGSEKDENIALLLSVENPSNKIEIVIHVNMLKEGWDVTNLYTIIPLRASASSTLTEQTIGRGLRLPYSKRTGNSKVDKLTIVSHDKFQAIIDAANEPDSIIKQENIIFIDPADYETPKQVITVESVTDEKIEDEEKRLEEIKEPEKKVEAQAVLNAKKILLSVLPEMSSRIKSLKDLTKEDEKKLVMDKVRQRMEYAPQQELFKDEFIKNVEMLYEPVISEFRKNTIEIPRIVLQQSGSGKAYFDDFELDVKNLNLQPVSADILRTTLRTMENETITGGRSMAFDDLDKIIINELINHSEVDYDSNTELLFKLAAQALKKFGSYLDKDGIKNVVLSNKKEIAGYIYGQMMEHFRFEPAPYEKPVIYSFSKIEEHNYSYESDKIHVYTDTIEPVNKIPSKLFGGFIKACHSHYKFDSKSEKDFAAILEKDKEVIKWLKPAYAQFSIYYHNNQKRYIPDFIVETESGIYMVEIKAENELESTEVKEKAQAGMLFCRRATEFTVANNGKIWKYSLIPHSAVAANRAALTLINKYIQ